MARTLPNSKLNPDADPGRHDAYNRAINRGEDLARQLKVDQVRDQPNDVYASRAERNSTAN